MGKDVAGRGAEKRQRPFMIMGRAVGARGLANTLVWPDSPKKDKYGSGPNQATLTGGRE